MNTVHFHLLLNHFPVIGTLMGSCLLLWGIIKKQVHTKNMAAAILGLMAIIAVPVYLTGEPAEEAVENLPGVSEAIMELHEEAAGIAIWLMGITGILALVAVILSWKNHLAAGIIFTITFVASVICFAAMARTGYYGGQIRHTETGAARIMNQQNEKQEGNKAKEKDDD